MVPSAGDDGNLEFPVIWMSVHAVLRQVGVAIKSDGTLLSEVDREANALAGGDAKIAATGRRVAETIRTEILAVAQEVTDMGKWIAHATIQANHSDVGNGTAMQDWKLPLIWKSMVYCEDTKEWEEAMDSPKDDCK